MTRRIGFNPLVLALGWVGVELAIRPLGMPLGLLAGCVCIATLALSARVSYGQTVACCMPNGTCQNFTAGSCTTIGGRAGVFGSACQGDNNGNGIDDACEEIIPAVSNVGLALLLLLTLVAGVVVIRRGRRGHAAG